MMAKREDRESSRGIPIPLDFDETVKTQACGSRTSSTQRPAGTLPVKMLQVSESE
jgi:hypothetical protein